MTRPLSAVLLFTLLAFTAAGLDVPPPPTQWVTDRAGLLGGTEVDLLNAKLRNFEQETGAQFIIYIFPSLEGEVLEDFAIRAVERWKVGQKKYDNGLVLFVFAKEKRVRVEVGYGLEGSVTDNLSSRVIRDVMAPRFQQNDYAGGLNAAADELMGIIRKGEAPVEPLNRPGGGQQAEGEDIGIIPALVVLFIVFFVILPMFSRGRRRGGCGGCMFPFIFPGGGITLGGGGFSSGGFGGGFGGGGGGFSGGGGGFGGGGASGGW